MKNNKLVVFDLDGTLNRTELYAVPAQKKVLAELGIYNVTDEMIIATFGARAQDSIPLLLNTSDETKIKEYMQKSSAYEDELMQEYAGEFDGVSAMLDSLREKGYTTAVCSNASERYIRLVLDALHIIEKIDFIQPLLPDLTKDDTLRLLLERVTPEKAVMVGDRVYDKNAAKANNIPFIGCLYGFNASEVEAADVAVSKACDIVAGVDKLIG